MSSQRTKLIVIIVSIFVGGLLVSGLAAANRILHHWQKQVIVDNDLWQGIEGDNAIAVEVALDKGANPNSMGDAGLNEHHTLITALEDKDAKIVKELLAHGADPTIALYKALNAQEAKKLIAIGASVNGTKGNNRLTLLGEHCAEGHDDVVELLLRHGADPTLKDEEGYTPRQRVQYAADNHPEMTSQYSRVIKLLDHALLRKESRSYLK